MGLPESRTFVRGWTDMSYESSYADDTNRKPSYADDMSRKLL